MTRAVLGLRVVPVPRLGAAGWRLVERNFAVYRHGWLVFLTGFLEPLLYLLSIGVGVSHLVGGFTEPGGHVIDYTSFVAPGMLAASAMNGALFDATYNIFFRLKYAKLYDAVLATPLGPTDVAQGEITWALLRGGVYSAMFVVVMLALGLISSVWAVLVLPAALLTAFAFAGAGMALTTWMRSWQDFEFITLVTLPMFLFSATFYPLSTYPPAVRWIVECTPLYQGVHLCRSLSTGDVGPGLVVPVVYLIAMGSIGLRVASRRLGVLLLR